MWWLVSPHNPLKPARGMAPQAERLARAERAARHPRIRVSRIEAVLDTSRTVDTLAALTAARRRQRFVWIMGADNLLQLPLWHRWVEIFGCVPIAVFDRPTYSLRALQGKAARRFRASRIRPGRARRLALMAPPAWVFLDRAHDHRSATAIRERAGRPGAP